jgi:hypothetical protein
MKRIAYYSVSFPLPFRPHPHLSHVKGEPLFSFKHKDQGATQLTDQEIMRRPSFLRETSSRQRSTR